MDTQPQVLSIFGIVIVLLTLIVPIYLSGFWIYILIKRKGLKVRIEGMKTLPVDEKQFQLMKLQAQKEKFKTNHILHFLLSLATIGLWVIPWFLVSFTNSLHKNNVERIIDNI